MDPALLKEREAFLKRAKATPAVEKRKSKSGNDGNDKKAKKAKIKPPTPKPVNTVDYKLSQGSSQYKFGVLAKIVKYMKSRHQTGINDPLLLEEILDETNQLDITSKMKHWLLTESLVNNPKIVVVKEDGVSKFCFKPKFDVHDKKSLVKLLRSHDLHGRGGILIDDIEESLPNMQKVLKTISDYIIYVKQPQNKKEVLFYNDRYCRFSVDEEFQKLWRSVPVEGLDDQKIEEYLNKQGITSMEASGYKKVSALPRRKKGKQKPRSFKKHNDHLEGVLQDYTENPPGK
ncbi:general transcription factor IIE subunit 2-like isoform X2 [Physella acuta]|nr:general transcription factor IIE subunit 2-like isoform X2 [Physella acuta]XP_059145011.1 general transcription factor IIE subunit 2-like isoform X2 [Physella acuta]XP_059145012.1 general transcription factor IIE subunit 2-like isoform X2 [Physella acuta]XP_059145013.1 general transcription factor IIE subunit 2-like isoform X2 [Physella acuta]